MAEDYKEWCKRMDDINDRIHEAFCGEEHRVAYSAYSTDADGNPIDNLDEVAIEGGPYRVFVKGDDFFGSGEDYLSGKEYTNPTWLELAVEANLSIAATEDYHHVFLESAKVKDGVIELWFGS